MLKYVLATGVLGAAPAVAGAAVLQAQIVLNGNPLPAIVDNGPYDTDATLGTIVTNHIVLAPFLGGTGVDFFFSVSTSNSPGNALAGILQRRELTVINTLATPLALRLTVSDGGFVLPGAPGSPMRIDSSQGGVFAFSPAGDGVTFQSFVNDGGANLSVLPVVPAGTTATAPLSFTTVAVPAGLQNYSETNSALWVRSAPAYSLANITTAVLSPGSQGNLGGTTVVTVVPEPTGIVAVAVGLLGIGRRRR